MAWHNPPAIEDLLYGLTVNVLLSWLEVKQRWAQSVRGWVTGAYNAQVTEQATGYSNIRADRPHEQVS
jgi:hypothetical protein